LQYLVNNYSAIYNDYWNSHQFGNPPPPSVDAKASNLTRMAFNLNLSEVAVYNKTNGPGWQEWQQEFNGSTIANSGQIIFQIYPPTSTIIELLIIEEAGWHAIPSNFPLDVSASEALNSAESYATTELHLGYIAYAHISLQIIQDHLYYAATVSDQSKTYVLFVNPITGEIGLPQ